MRGMAGLQIGVALVGCIAGAELLQRAGCLRFMRTQAEPPVAGVVDVVTDKEHCVQILRGDLAVGREPALLIVLAGRERQTQSVHHGVCGGRGAGASDGAGDAADQEAVPIAPRRPQVVHLHPHAVRLGWIGQHGAAAHDASERLVLRHLPGQRYQRLREAAVGLRRVRHQACPQHHALRARLAAGDTQRKRIVAEPRIGDAWQAGVGG